MGEGKGKDAFFVFCSTFEEHAAPISGPLFPIGIVNRQRPHGTTYTYSFS